MSYLKENPFQYHPISPSFEAKSVYNLIVNKAGSRGMDERVPFPLECSSGCESGWTMYFDQSGRTTSFSAEAAGLHGRFAEEEEGLSMVSDASSGPPHVHEEEDNCDENGCFCSASSAALMKKKKISKRRRVEAEEKAENSSILDDTASSHVLLLSKNSSSVNSKQSSMEEVFDFSMGFSATHFKKHYNIVQSPSIPVKPTSAKPLCREEGRRNKIC